MTRVTRAQARRRRAVTAPMSCSVLALLGILGPKGSSGQLTAPSGTAPPATSAGSPAVSPTGSTQPVPAWLAWMSGGFPATFRDQISGAGGLTQSVVVAGDTRWMTSSHDASGNLVEQPTPPYAISLYAFSVVSTRY